MHKFQLGFKNHIKKILPHNCDHLADTLQVVFEWDAIAGKTNDTKDVEIPVDFPPDLVHQYETVQGIRSIRPCQDG